ncbi:MAG: formyltransferase family protein, partial [Ilumatobacter sp.]
MTRPRLVVLASGNGSNLQALIDAVDEGHINGQIVAVVSDRPESRALTR